MAQYKKERNVWLFTSLIIIQVNMYFNNKEILKNMVIEICKHIFDMKNNGSYKKWSLKYKKYYLPLFRYYNGKEKIKFAFKLIKNEFQKEISIIPRIAFYITTRCTLKCEACSALTPYFPKKEDYHAKNIIKDIQKLESIVDKIQVIDFFGGETLLHNELKEILSYANKSSKIEKVELMTNGMPNISEEIIEELKNPKITVYISDYGSINKEYLLKKIKIFKRESIQYVILKNSFWYDFGVLKDYRDNKKKRDIKYEKCFVSEECLTIYKGRFMPCARGALLIEKNILTSDMYTIYKTFDRKFLYRYFSESQSEICNYCGLNYQKIGKAKQIENGN